MKYDENSSPEERLALAEARFERVTRDYEKAVKDKEELSKLLDGLLESASWKLTKPLRDVVRWIRTTHKLIFPIYSTKRAQLEIEPGRSTAKGENGFTITGPSPILNLKYLTGVRVSGWVTLRARLKCDKSHLFFYLCFPTSSTVSDQEKVLVPLCTDGKNETLFRLPANHKSLRLEPFATDGAFELLDLSLQQAGSLQVIASVLKKHLGRGLSNPRMVLSKFRKLYAVWREGGFHSVKIRLFANQFTADYADWVKRYDTLTERDHKQITAHIERLQFKPLISVLMPTYNTPERWLRKAIESVQQQLYANWELCIADDASTDPLVKQVLEEYAAKDKRIKIKIREKNGHISEASNSCLELASGDYIALLDHDDELTLHALYLVVNELNIYPNTKFIYSDEDKLTSFGMRFNPYFKSDWNPELLLSQNYLCHLCVYKTDLVRKIGGFRKGFEGAQDWDLALRATDEIPAGEIRHIPHVLYHWRVIEGSTAQSTSFKPYVLKSQQRAVQEHLSRRGLGASQVDILESIAQLQVTLPVPNPEPLVTLIIPTKDKVEILRTCVDTILKKTTYKNFEIVIVDNNSSHPDTFKYFESLRSNPKVQIVADRSPFNYSRINNTAARAAKGELIGLINNDLEVINPDWLSLMVSFAVRPEIGAVGARLLYPNELLQHGGVIMGIGGVAGHNHKGIRRENPGYFNRAILTQALSGVTAACLIIRKSTFLEAGGLDEESLAVAFNDVDFCLRVRERGYRNVYVAQAELYHHESASRGLETTPEKYLRFEGETEIMKRRWGRKLETDPFYNPNLTLLTEDFAFAFPPRAEKPWM